jgi:hypothetical protein
MFSQLLFKSADAARQRLMFGRQALQPLLDRNAVQRFQNVFDNPHAGNIAGGGALFQPISSCAGGGSQHPFRDTRSRDHTAETSWLLAFPRMLAVG